MKIPVVLLGWKWSNKAIRFSDNLDFSDFCSETKWTWLMLLWANWPSKHYARFLERYIPFFSQISLDIISFIFIAISFDFCFYFHCNIFWFLLLKKKSKIKKTQSTIHHHTWCMKSFHHTYLYIIFTSQIQIFHFVQKSNLWTVWIKSKPFEEKFQLGWALDHHYCISRG